MKSTPRTQLAAQIFASRIADVNMSPELQEGETAETVTRSIEVEVAKEIKRSWRLSGEFGKAIGKIQKAEQEMKSNLEGV